MRKCTKYPKMFTVLFTALLLSVAVAGCRGSLGWERMQISLEHQNQSGLDLSRPS